MYGSTGAGNSAAVYPPGYQIALVTNTASISVTSTVSGSPTDVISLGAVAFDGTACFLEFFSSDIIGVSGQTLTIDLWDNTTQIDTVAVNAATNTTLYASPVFVSIPITPSAATHTYKVRGWVTNTGTATVSAGPGGANAKTPMWIRAVKA